MIDVHCLVHKEDDKYLPLLVKQMQEEDCVNFFLVENGPNIGFGRAGGFLRGNAPYVSYVDYDDLIVPGIFKKINEVMDDGFPWCYTDEMLIDEEGKEIQPGWSSHPELYSPYLLSFVSVGAHDHVHHILTFRRDILTPKMLYIMDQLAELPEEYLRSELEKYHYKHIEEVGYYWRQHPDNTIKQYRCHKDMERVANDKRSDIGGPQVQH